MDKIFRRSTLIKNVEKKEKKNRRRNITVNFRVSPEEKKLIDDRIALSGMLRVDYFIQSVLHQKINITGNIRTFDEMKKKMKEIDSHLCSIEKAEKLDFEMVESLRMILEILDGIYGNAEKEKGGEQSVE